MTNKIRKSILGLQYRRKPRRNVLKEIKMLDKVIDIIREQLNIDDVEITEETSFKDDLGVDSLDLLELVMAFEEEYNIELDPEELEGIQTVGDIIDYIKKYTDQ